MPKPVNRQETTDLHAPWWSDAKDASGRYVERWVVRTYMTERDEQQVSEQMQSRLRSVTGGKSGKQLGNDLMQQVIANSMAFARLYLLLQMTEELTDDSGVAQHVTREFLSQLDKRDTAYVNEQLDVLYGKPDVEVLTEDEEYAEQMRAAAEEGAPVDPATLSAEGRAATRFRGTGKVTQLRG